MKRLLAAAAIAAALALSPAARADEPKAGGSIVITYKDDLPTLDPAVGYDWQNWSVIKSIFDGLMDYKPGTTELVPDLAESFTISSDGTVYTFKLRPGIKFQNGRALTSADIKYSIERAINPKTQCPGQSYFGMIKGYDEAAAGKTGDVSGITTPDPATVRFELKQPDATFLHIMAINFGYAVPKEEVEKYGADFGKHPVGTGAFKVGEWTLGQRLVLEKNPLYYHKGIPYLDKITFEFGQEPSVALLRLQKGEVDILGDPIPAASFNQVMADPKNKGLIVEGSQLQTGYVTMNVNIKPFDNKLVRQAVNMAINKARIVRIINNRAVPANQVLPPLMPGYDKGFKGYPYDQAKAKDLLKQAGYPDGFATELYAMNADPNPRIAQAIQQDLAAVGIKAEIKALDQAAVIAAGGDGTAPMIWSGGMAWIADFPDPSNFYSGILGCGGAVKGGWNWSWYCNKALDEKADKANAIVDPAKTAERLAIWQEVFAAVMDDAPWAPIFNEERFTMHSPRLGGEDALFNDPIHIPIDYDYIYVKDGK
jgi:peptide/nickel transport system substrate-binding protein/oligopeptide transport system substrate-binding protein